MKAKHPKIQDINCPCCRPASRKVCLRMLNRHERRTSKRDLLREIE